MWQLCVLLRRWHVDVGWYHGRLCEHRSSTRSRHIISLCSSYVTTHTHYVSDCPSQALSHKTTPKVHPRPKPLLGVNLTWSSYLDPFSNIEVSICFKNVERIPIPHFPYHTFTWLCYYITSLIGVEKLMFWVNPRFPISIETNRNVLQVLSLCLIQL